MNLISDGLDAVRLPDNIMRVLEPHLHLTPHEEVWYYKWAKRFTDAGCELSAVDKKYIARRVLDFITDPAIGCKIVKMAFTPGRPLSDDGRKVIVEWEVEQYV